MDAPEVMTGMPSWGTAKLWAKNRERVSIINVSVPNILYINAFNFLWANDGYFAQGHMLHIIT